MQFTSFTATLAACLALGGGVEAGRIPAVLARSSSLPQGASVEGSLGESISGARPGAGMMTLQEICPSTGNTRLCTDNVHCCSDDKPLCCPQSDPNQPALCCPEGFPTCGSDGKCYVPQT